VLDEFEQAVGRHRLGSLHLNDSQTPLGSNRDRHANIGEGELGIEGARTFVNEPRFSELCCVLETPGPDRSGPTAEEVALVKSLIGARGRGKGVRK
jgi:deoxyribonuclease-4